MTQIELLKEVSKRSGVSQETVSIVYRTLVDTIKEKLLFGIEISLYNFLNFKIQKLNARKINNPSGGDDIDVPKRYKVKVDLPRGFQKKMAEKPVY